MDKLKEMFLTLLCIMALFYEGESNTFTKSISIQIMNQDNLKTEFIQPGISRRLIVTCNINTTGSDELKPLEYISLTHYFNKQSRLVSVLTSKSVNGSGVGRISQNGQSYLKRTWNFPDSDNEGKYQCEFAGRPIPKRRRTFEYQEIFASKTEKIDNCTTRINIEAVSKRTNSQTKNIEPGITKTLLVQCSVDVTKRMYSVEVESISLHYYKSGRTESVLIASVSATNQKKPKDKGAMEYDIMEGYMSVQWSNPGIEKGGKYKCMTVVRMESGKQEVCSSHDEIFAVPVPTCSSTLVLSTKIHNAHPFSNCDEPIIRTSLTTSLELNCTLNNPAPLELDTLHTLKLKLSKTNGFVTTVATVSTLKKVKKVGTGIISKTGTSFVSMTFTLPDTDQEGTYICEAIAKSTAGKEQKCSVSKNISSDPKEMCYTTITTEAVPNTGEARTCKLEPIYIEPGLTRKLLVSCSFDVRSAQYMNKLRKLVLLRAKSAKSDFKDVASINMGDKHPKISDSETVVNAVFSESGESYLTVEWTYPGYETAGTYKCEAHGNSELVKNNAKTCSSSVAVISKEMSLQSVAEQFRLSLLEKMKLLNAIKKLNEMMKTINGTITLLKGKIEELKHDKTIEQEKANTVVSLASNYIDSLKNESITSLNNLFYESKLNKSISNSRYYLAKSATFAYPELAQEVCAYHGGYLAEMNNILEYRGVQQFLNLIKARNLFNYILISGSNLIDGTYHYTKDNKKSQFILPTIVDENAGRKWNCVYLENKFDGQLDLFIITVEQCVMKTEPLSYSYLCEIEEVQ